VVAVQISRNSVVPACERDPIAGSGGRSCGPHLQGGHLQGLEQIGESIWALISVPRAIGEICDTLVDEIEPDACERDVVAIAGELTAKGPAQNVDAARLR
jgi:hypothetical protein